jgi:tetratricopeptide (TPR) repeat protein
MNTRLANPYVVGAPLSGNQGFYGREDVFKFVRDTLVVPAQNVIVLYGQRRIGKTSLLHQLIARIGDDFHAVLFDLQGRGQHDLPVMLIDLSAAIARSLKLPALEPSAFDSGRDAFRETFLPEVAAALGSRRLLILFDEFDVLGDESSTSDGLGGNQLFGYLRAWLAHDPRLACIFVIGRRLDELPIHYRSLFKQAVFRRLSVLPRPDAVELITQPAAGALDFAPDAIDAILDLSAGHPYLTQLVCHVVFKRLVAADRHTVTPDDVSACLDEALEIGTGGLDWFWEGLPRAERLMLSALAEAMRNGPPASSRATIAGANGKSHPAVTEEELFQTLSRHRVRLLGVELTGARQRLLEWEILARDGNTYRFVIDLVRRWIAREHPLDRAQQDIDLISQRATRYFNNARDAHLVGDLSLAIEDYRRALVANPNHFGAQLGLAQALQESSDLPAAIAEYEKAYQIDPSSARDGLVSARLAFGIAHHARGDLDAAVIQLEHVLRLAPSDDEAQTRLIDIWIQRGEAELARQQYASAVDAFSRALNITPDAPALQTRIKSIVRRFSETAETRLAWEVAFESLSLLAEHLPGDEQLQTWLNDTRARWRAHNYYEMARRARSAGDHQTTIEECRRALESNPNHAQARLMLAAALQQIGELTSAIAEYAQAYRLDPQSTAAGLAQALLQRAAALEARSELVAAAADYEAVLELTPGADGARQRLPEIYMRWGDEHLAAPRLDEAVAAYRKALLVAAQPHTLARPIKSRLAEFSQARRAAGDWDAAIAAIARLRTDLMMRDRETDGWLIDLWLARGETALNAGRYDDSAPSYKQALQVAADAGDPAPTLGRIKARFFTHANMHLQSERPEAAIGVFTALINITGSDAETFAALAHVWSVRGDIDFKRGRLAEAESAFHRALELQPDSQEIMARLTAVAERRRQAAIEKLRAEGAIHAERRAWAKAEEVYRQLVVEYHDEASRPLFAHASEETRLEELYALAQSFHSTSSWDAAIPIWLTICHSRGDYVGRDGQNAILLLAEAIAHRAGIAQANETALSRLKRRVRLAWIVAIALGAIAIGEVIFAFASGLLKLP